LNDAGVLQGEAAMGQTGENGFQSARFDFRLLLSLKSSPEKVNNNSRARFLQNEDVG
jgi:hypothetical protein